MKFLTDRCAGRRLADWLREQGYEVLESQERGIDPGDSTILSWAHAEGRFASGHEHCGVVRLPDVPAEHRIALMDLILARHSEDLEAGALITVRGERLRVSRRS